MIQGQTTQSDTTNEISPIGRALARLIRLIGGLDTTELKVRVGLALALTLVSKVFIVGAPLVLAQAVNRLTSGSNPSWDQAFLLMIGTWAFMRFLGTGAPQLRDTLFQAVSEEAQRRAGVKIFGHVHGLGIRFHQSKRTGAVWRTIERGVRAIDFLTRFVAFNIGPTLIELVLAASVLGWRYGWLFAAIATTTVILYTYATLAITEWRLRYRRDMNDADSEATGRAVDSLLNYETVKAFAAEVRETERYNQAVRAYAKASVHSNATLQGLNAAQGFIQNLGLAAMVAAAGYAISRGTMGAGDIAAVTLVMLNLYGPLNILGFAWREIKQSSIDMEAMYALLDEVPDIADRPDARALVLKGGVVTFDRVAFTHDGRHAGLSEVSFTIESGKTVAIVGPSGSGKSTIVRLLFRFYDPQSGRVLIDGQDLTSVTQESVRAAIGLVPQDVVLFNDTLAYNIAYGRPEAPMEQIEEAATMARLGSLIAGAPLGLLTRVGERGLKLSGGERQRVGIARAILKNPPILVLDEATSSLDSVTEAEVREALEDAAKGRTTLVVAHRLSTVADADEIIVLADGQVAERGTHGDLLKKGGVYAHLWDMQARSEPVAQELFADPN
ncbi:ABCB family ABC transporter ATP-binding protein/permease [Candidatus Phycosocius spiralis]|nr:ABC transporter ATP-binding protein/permease [Candidatus Phycosocius spiralis]